MKYFIPLFLFIGVVLFSCNDTARPPKVDVDPVVDLGDVTIDDTIRTSLVYKNLENKDIRIDYIKTPCGCITAYPKDQVVLSKDSTMIMIIYRPLDIGYTEQHLFVYYRDFQVPTHLLIKCKIHDKTDSL